ncbi:hypothetical protein [Allokutzneria sp. A3M-2-11 16]|nr:hypothetical protein [Allokutzneria sp. A3M-2-11 16]
MNGLDISGDAETVDPRHIQGTLWMTSHASGFATSAPTPLTP